MESWVRVWEMIYGYHLFPLWVGKESMRRAATAQEETIDSYWRAREHFLETLTPLNFGRGFAFAQTATSQKAVC
jgi:hypothetical protein